MSVRRRAVLVSLLVPLVGAGGLAAPQLAVAAPVVACGATLTADAALTRDLTCSGAGLVLAPDVTLDLAGHTLRGPGTGVGVLVPAAGHSTVRGGTLAGWATGIDIQGVEDDTLATGPMTVDGVRFRDNGVGVDASGEDGSGRYAKPTTITRSTFVRHTRAGVLGEWYAGVTVDASTFTDNATGLWNEGYGQVTGSRFTRNAHAVIVGDASYTVEDSVFEHNARAVVGFGDAILTVTGSRFTGSQVAVDASAYLDLASSTFVANEHAVRLGWMHSDVRDNVLRANGDAITTDEASLEDATIQGNSLRQNGDGIVLEPEGGGSVLVGGNDVRGSARRGIHVPGAVDLGGNTARGNGSDPQCVGVVCATS